MGAVRGVLLDESLLVAESDGGGDLHLPPAADALLRRLRHSKLRVGICHKDNAPTEKVNFLTKTAALYSFDSVSLSTSQSALFSALLQTWNGIGGTSFYATSIKDEALFCELQNQRWKIICRSVDSQEEGNNGLFYINKLEELFMTLCNFGKMEMHDASVLTIGYVMKLSREEDFAKRGAFPMYPTDNGLMFVPLSFDLPLTFQMQQVDAVLHKATDEIISIDPYTSNFSEGISFSKGMCELERYTQDHSDFCIIDPLSNICPLLDRLKIQHILHGLVACNINASNVIRAPHFLKVAKFQQSNLKEQLSEAKLSFPVIVKPQVACGVAHAHNMALIFKLEDFTNLSIPLPAIIQEYVDHGSLLFKFYVLGDKVFHAVKKSMPNADALLSSLGNSGSAPLVFDSLKSLPIAKQDQHSVVGSNADKQPLDSKLVHNAADWLRRRLGLTIFGFDVVIQEGTGDHVIVDLNYLPSFKEVPDKDAIPAFWDAIRSAYELWRSKQVLKPSTRV